MTLTYTTNRSYPKPDFDTRTWHDQMHQSLDMIDSDVTTFFRSPSFFVEAWSNNKAYIVNDKVLDTITLQMFQCNVNHTSVATGSFLGDRTSHPTYWTAFGTPLVPRGQWFQNIQYAVLDHVYDANLGIVGICSLAHTSTPTGNIKTDAAKWLFVVDNSLLMGNTAANAAAAAASASAAGTSATNAANSASAALSSQNASATNASNAQVYAGNASASATSATNSASSATSSASSALSSKNAAGVSEVNAANSAAAAASSASSALAAAVQVSDTPPVAPTQGKMWFDSASSQLYVRYDDGTSAQWVIAVNNPPDLSGYALTTYVDNQVGRGGYRNLLRRNGGFEVWQRGAGGSASFPFAPGVPTYAADGWYYIAASAQPVVVSQAGGLTDGSAYSVRIQRNAGSVGSGNSSWIGFPLDTDELVPMRGKYVRLSFVGRAGANFSAVGGVITPSLRTGTSPPARVAVGPWVGPVNVIATPVNLTATAIRFQVNSSIVIPTNATQAEVFFEHTFAGTAGADDSFYIDDVQLEIVPAATGYVSSDFERLNFQEQLLLCQRHYQKTFNYITAPGGGASVGSGEVQFMAGNGAGVSIFNTFRFPVPMRVQPTGTIWQIGAAAANQLFNYSTATSLTSSSITTQLVNAQVVGTTPASTAANHLIVGHATFDAGI